MQYKLHNNDDGHASVMDSVNGELTLIEVNEELVSDTCEFLKCESRTC